MRYLIFSDVHGNLPALEEVLSKEKNVFGYINLGDVVNYGPWSNECIQLIDSLQNCKNLKGNHEEYFESGYCNIGNPLVEKFFTYSFKKFNNVNIIKEYHHKLSFNNFFLSHNLKSSKKYFFKDTEVDISHNTMIGHSHQQYLRVINDKYTLLNPGSIGQNRKNINIANYVIWEVEKNDFHLKELAFDIDYVIDEMKSRGYPSECIKYYENKNKA